MFPLVLLVWLRIEERIPSDWQDRGSQGFESVSELLRRERRCCGVGRRVMKRFDCEKRSAVELADL